MYNPQLDTFVCVAEEGSFSRAAAALYITPTAVIKQMNLLESRLGVTLFNRSHQGLSLTRAGESLLADARHIIQYSQESVARACAADRGEKRIVRVGVSPLTPSTYISQLWPAVRKRCPGMGLQVVNFENTPRAPATLANLGLDIDVVCGIYDDMFLREHGCDAMELVQEPVCCAVALGDELASRERITLSDLHGRKLMLIRNGWNASLDGLRRRIHAEHPQIELVDFPQYRAEVFNRCANEGLALAAIPLWEGVQPMLKIVPTDWDCTVAFGVMHAPEPAPHVRELLEALADSLAEGELGAGAGAGAAAL